MKIISTIDEVQKYLPVLMTSEITVIEPFLNNAERSYLLSLIGKEQFTVLAAAYATAEKHTEGITDEIIREAVEIAQKIVTTIGYYKAVPVLSLKIGDSGIQVFSNQDTKQAFNWQVEDLKDALLDLGYGAIEDLLLHLESNPDVFPEYISSEQFKASEQFMFENASDFSQYLNISGSRYIFQSIAYLMRRIEDQSAKRIFGPVFFDTLKEDNLEGKRKVLVNQYIKPGIALLTAAKAIVERVITFDNGVARINLITNYEAAKNTIVANRDLVQAATDQLTTDGNLFFQDGLQYIADNPADFIDYVPPLSRKRYNVLNNPTGGIVIF